MNSIEEIKASFNQFPKFNDWAKVISRADTGYGSPVEIIWTKDYLGYVDHGYLTRLTDVEGDWDEVGVVHITHIDGDEMEGQDYNSLYALCKNPLIKYIKIGSRP